MLEEVKIKLATNDESLKLVADEIIKRCETEPEFIAKILNDNKSLSECWEYIKYRAKEKAKGKSSVAITDAEVYGWAVHYFWEDELEDWKSVKVRSTTSKKTIKEDPDELEEDDEGSEEDPVNKQIIAKPEPTKKPKGVVDGQLSLFDL